MIVQQEELAKILSLPYSPVKLADEEILNLSAHIFTESLLYNLQSQHVRTAGLMAAFIIIRRKAGDNLLAVQFEGQSVYARLGDFLGMGGSIEHALIDLAKSISGS